MCKKTKITIPYPNRPKPEPKAPNGSNSGTSSQLLFGKQ